MRGLKSPQGRRGAICAHFGWRLDYLTDGLPWAQVLRMMADAPGYEPGDGGAEEHSLTGDNAADIAAMINGMIPPK